MIGVLLGRPGVFSATLSDSAVRIRGKRQTAEAVTKLRRQRVVDLVNAGLLHRANGELQATLPGLQPIFKAPNFRRCLSPGISRLNASNTRKQEAETTRGLVSQILPRAARVGSKPDRRGRNVLGRFVKAGTPGAVVVDIEVYRQSKRKRKMVMLMPPILATDKSSPISPPQTEARPVGQMFRVMTKAENNATSAFLSQMPEHLKEVVVHQNEAQQIAKPIEHKEGHLTGHGNQITQIKAHTTVEATGWQS